MLKETIVEQLTEEQKTAVVKLWNNEYPASFSLDGPAALDASFGHYGGQEHLLLTDETDQLLGWGVLFDFMEGRWGILILDRSIQRQGIGSRLLDLAKSRTNNLNAWMVVEDELVMKDNNHYPAPEKFYEKHGFTVHHDIKWDAVSFDVVKISWQADD